MLNQGKLSASLEDYLEAILHLVKENHVARVSDIAMELKVKKASVTGALRSLKEKKFVNYQPYSYITLTKTGEKQARAISRRHRILKKFFSNVLSVNNKNAEKNACEVEHAISDELFNKLVKFIEFIDNCPIAGKILGDKFKNNCSNIDAIDKNNTCLETCLNSFRS